MSLLYVPFDDQFDETYHLCLCDIAIDNQDNPQMLQVKIKHSKTDPFHKGVNIYLGATRRDLCPIRGILPYLALRGSHLAHSLYSKMEEALLNISSRKHMMIYYLHSTWIKRNTTTIASVSGWPPQLSKQTFLTFACRCWAIGEVTLTSITSKPICRNLPSYLNTSQMATLSLACSSFKQAVQAFRLN